MATDLEGQGAVLCSRVPVGYDIVSPFKLNPFTIGYKDFALSLEPLNKNELDKFNTVFCVMCCGLSPLLYSHRWSTIPDESTGLATIIYNDAMLYRAVLQK